jgi:hypothetical protein
MARRAPSRRTAPRDPARDAGPPSTPRERLLRAAPAAAFALVLLGYAALRTYQFHLSDSDESIYFYMALRTAFGGLLPYRDYFFAHPPLHLGLAVIALKVGALLTSAQTMVDAGEWADGGAGLVAVKSIGILVGALGGVFVYRAVRRVSGALEAFLAGTLFLFSPDLLGGYFTGVTEALMFAALALERTVAGRDRQAGLAFAAGCLVAMYVAPCGLAVWFVLLATARRRAITLALWTAVPLIVVHGIFLLWAGKPYFVEVFAFHLEKPKVVGVFGHELLLMLRRSPLLVFGAPAAVAAIWRGSLRETFDRARIAEDRRVQLAAFCLASSVATLLFVGTTRAVFHYYFVMLMLGAAPLAGLGYGELLRRAGALVQALRAPGAPRRAPALALATLLVWPLAGTALARLPAARRTQVPDKAVGQAAPRTWHPSPVLGPLDGVVHALVWSDEEQLGRVYPVWTRALWDASQRFEMADVFARFARDGLPPGATIFGDPSLADTVALLSGRHVALDEADTNFMRFRSGVTPAEPFIDRLRAAPPALIIFSVGEYMNMGDALIHWMEADYESNMANDSGGLVYVVMRPRAAAAHDEKSR